MQYGNGTVTTYNYEPERRRLARMTALTSKSRKMMDNTYKYDAMDNITALANAADKAATNQQGGPASYAYAYDDLYRLTSSTGKFEDGKGQAHAYTFAMAYTPDGNITTKNQQHTIKGSVQKETSYAFEYAYEGAQPHAANNIGGNDYQYDPCGNPVIIKNGNNGHIRRMAWDEENRLLAIADNGNSHHYVYDAGGQRVIKAKGDGQYVSVNGFNPSGVEYAPMPCRCYKHVNPPGSAFI